MDFFWLLVGMLFIFAGIIGSLVPFIPGPPLAYMGLLLQQLKSTPPFTIRFLGIWAVITLAIFVIDYIIPIYGTRRFGGTKYGIWGSTLGLIFGFFWGPMGIILGPLVGAFLGELLATNNSDKAFKSAMGSFLGFVFGSLLKMVVCIIMGWYVLSPYFE